MLHLMEEPTEPRSDRAAAFREGLVAVSPLLVGVAPFGLVAGAAVAEAGLHLQEAIGFSTVIFAGASQLAALDLLGQDAPVAVAVLTALVINSRMLMYAASMAPLFAGLPKRQRALGAYLLVDQAYALTVSRVAKEPTFRPWFSYYLGTAAALWVTWQTTTILGVLVGDAVPDSVPLEFAVPVTFLALLAPSVTDRPALTAAAVAAAVATLGAPLPANLGMILGSLAGIGAGFVHSMRRFP